MIAIVDYGLGNVGAIKNMFTRIGAEATVTADVNLIAAADKLVLSGIGAFDEGMKNLAQLGLLDVLNRQVIDRRTPILGICLGMQLFGRRSTEGSSPGLGWIAADVVRFKFPPGATERTPHMGWNTLSRQRVSPILADLGMEARFYFAHSYYLECDEPGDVVATTLHGVTICAVLEHQNIIGTQFHPEKSHRFGSCVLRNFAKS